MMQKIIDYFKQYIGVISIVLALCILLTYSLSYFKVNIDNKRAAEMYIGELKYSMTIEGNSTNTLSVPAGETIVDVNITNQNGVDTYFKLLYLKNDNVTISYYDETKDTSEAFTKYLSSGELLEKGITGTLKLKIINNSSSAQTLTFSVSGGYSTNKLTDVDVPSSYSEITTMETTSSNTYFCDTLTNDPLSQGTKYTDGQYTYRYKQEGAYSSTTYLAWNNISDGWGVQLTDKSSTDPVTSKVCTYINNKPVISMSCTFNGSKATTLDVSSFDTSNVKNMSLMFYNSQATTLDVSSFNTSNVTDMKYMFSNSQATTLDLSSFNTSNVKNMSLMFWNSQATTLDLSSFSTSNVTDMKSMFESSQATTLDLSSFNTSNVTDMSRMFRDSKATTLDVSNFDTSKVSDMNSMFHSSKATTLDVSNFNTSNVRNMSQMFRDSKATTLDVSSFNTSNVTNMSTMFYSSQATTLDLSSFNTSNVTNMKAMFNGSKATTLDVSGFDTSKVTDMNNMFSSSQATTLDLSSFDTSKVTFMYSMFESSQATTLDLSSFNTAKVTNMRSMFAHSKKLKTIYVSNNFITNNVNYSPNMFVEATNLVGGAGTVYNSSHVDKTYARIDTASTPGYFTLKTN